VMSNDAQYTAVMRTATSPVGTGGNPNVGPPVSLPYRFRPLPTPVCVECHPPPSSPTKESSKPERPDDEKSGAGLATRATTKFRGVDHSSRTRTNGPHALSSHLEPHPTLLVSTSTPTLPLVSSLSRFSHPNPFASLTSDSESDDDTSIVDPESDEETTSISLPPHPRDSSDRPVTSPQPFTLLCPNVSRQPVSLPAPVSALSSVLSSKLSSPLIADSGCTSILIQLDNFPALSQFFCRQAPTPSPLHSARWKLS